MIQALKAGYSGLEMLLGAGKNAVLAANPVHDVTGFVRSAVSLVSQPDIAHYVENVKKGKFLGDGDFANVLFTSGAVMSGIYPALLGIRAVLGAGAYVGKRVATSCAGLAVIPRVLDRSWTYAGIEAVLGIKDKSIRKAMNRHAVGAELRKWNNNSYFRSHVQPVFNDAAIGASGYGTAIGTKWLASSIDSLAGKLADASSWRPVKYISKKVSAIAERVSNGASAYVTGSVFIDGVKDFRSFDGFELDWFSKTYLQHKWSELVETAQEYFDEVIDTGKNSLTTGRDSILDAGKYIFDGRMLHAVGEMYNEYSPILKDGFETIIAFGGRTWDSLTHGADYIHTSGLWESVQEGLEYLQKDAWVDIQNWWGGHKNNPTLAQVSTIPPQVVSVTQTMPTVFEQPQDTIFSFRDPPETVFNEDTGAEKYAVLVSGYDGDSGWENQRFVKKIEQVRSDLYEIGFPKENVILMKPNGGDVQGSEKNLETVLSQLGTKVGLDDTVVVYITGHGESLNGNSHVGLLNGKDTLHDYELKDMIKNIQAGKEIYFVGSCHAGGFADKLKSSTDIAITSSTKDQYAYSDSYNGNSMGSYFFDKLKDSGLDVSTSTTAIKSALKNARKEFNDNMGGRWHSGIRNQTPLFGLGNSVQPALL